MIRACSLLIAGGFAAQHSRVPLSSDLCTLGLVASLLLLCRKQTRGAGFLYVSEELQGSDLLPDRLFPGHARRNYEPYAAEVEAKDNTERLKMIQDQAETAAEFDLKEKEMNIQAQLKRAELELKRRQTEADEALKEAQRIKALAVAQAQRLESQAIESLNGR